MQVRGANTVPPGAKGKGHRPGPLSSPEAARVTMIEVLRAEREHNRMLASLPSTAAIPVDPEQERADRAEDDFINFLSQYGHAEASKALRAVEHLAVYCCTLALRPGDVDKMWSLHWMSDQLEAIGIAHDAMLVDVEAGKRPRRTAERADTKEAELIQHLGSYGYFNVMEGLRLAEKRAVYWQDDPLHSTHYPALLFYREFLDHLEALREGHALPNEARTKPSKQYRI